MNKINFEEFRIPTGISRERYQTVDVRESVADLLYTHVNGIRAHRLAFKIYESCGETEYSDEETALIRRAVETYCLPSVIDGLCMMLNKESTTDKTEKTCQ